MSEKITGNFSIQTAQCLHKSLISTESHKPKSSKTQLLLTSEMFVHHSDVCKKREALLTLFQSTQMYNKDLVPTGKQPTMCALKN